MTNIANLEGLGLSSQQARLYVAALEISPAGATALSKKADMERTACYSHLEELVKLGLINIAFEKGKRLYSAVHPRALGEILDDKNALYRKLLPELMTIYNVKGVKPRIQYYEGKEGMRTIMANTLLSGSKLNLHLVPMNSLMEVIGKEFSRKQIELRAQKGIEARTLRVREAIEGPWEVTSSDKSLLREIRYLPEGFKLDDLIIIHANTVAIISSAKENYGLEIESKEFADTMRSFFAAIWEVAEKK